MSISTNSRTELKEVGAGIQIGSNGTRVLYALGLEQALGEVRVLPVARELRHWSTGETWNWFELGETSARRFGTPHLMLHRGDLHAALLDAVTSLKPDAIALNKKCIAVSQTADTAEIRFEDGASAKGEFVIGADGIHSTVRAALFGASRPEFTGCVAWRGLIPMEKLPVAPPPHGRDELARTTRVRPALSGAPRRADEFHQHRRARRLAGRILGRRGHDARVGQRLHRLARRCADTHRNHRHALQMGADGARPDALDGAEAASPCSAMPAIRRFPSSARAP